MASLADFIEREHDRIVAEWEEHAKSLVGMAGPLLLRDHISDLLSEIAANMRSPQTKHERDQKAHGRGATGPLDRVSEVHALKRGEAGFQLAQIVSEYRALRASVLKLWEGSGNDASGIGRFNEAIDQAVAAAVERFTTMAEHYRDQSLGILGHDLRNPLSAVITGGTLLAGDALSTEQRHDMAARVVASGKRMDRMIRDLLDLTRTRFGDAIPIVRGPVDLDALCRDVVSELASQHAAGVRYVSHGDLRGEWDADRIAQVLSNLIRNAIEHGAPDEPVTVTATAERYDVVIDVHNRGPTISADALDGVFDPMVPTREASKRPGLGLGLFVAWHVVDAHEGDIRARSTDEDGTHFTVRLPRRARADRVEHSSVRLTTAHDPR